MKWFKKLFKKNKKTDLEERIEQFKDKKSEEESPQIPETRTKQECMDCILAGGEDCELCVSKKKCDRIRRKMKKAGWIK